MSNIAVINQSLASIPIPEIEINNFTTQLLKALKKSKKSVSIAFVSPEKIKSLNFQFRGINEVTDVLSFSPQSSESEVFLADYLGDCVLCFNVIENNAINNNVQVTEEVYRCIVHGILHLIGMDHKRPLNKKEAMFVKQEKLLSNILCL